MGFIDLPPNPTAPGKLRISIELNKEELQHTLDFLKTAAKALSEKRANPSKDSKAPKSEASSSTFGHGSEALVQRENNEVSQMPVNEQAVPMDTTQNKPKRIGKRATSAIPGKKISTCSLPFRLL